MSQPTQRSSGRGGAGNMSSSTPTGQSASATDLQTPTIKSATYTTGRGGSGNMATNDPSQPQVARAAQDVDAPAAHSREPRGTYHWGRGGEGNMVTVGGGAGGAASSEAAAGNTKNETGGVRPGGEQRRTESRETLGAALNGKLERRGSLQGVLDRGKEILGLKKDEKKISEAAIGE